MTKDLEEIVARALCDHEYVQPMWDNLPETENEAFRQHRAGDNPSIGFRENFREAARAAIAAHLSGLSAAGYVVVKREPDEATLERAARAVCGHSLSGFCRDVGGYLGCKVGRGEAFNGNNCIATRVQLQLCPLWEQGAAAISAALTTTESERT